jgi:selenocysteine lyase/cysteine desulfurase
MPNFEGIAGIEAAARFLIEEGMDQLAAAESDVFSRLLEGLLSIDGVKVWGSQTLEGRVPTAAFTIAGVHPADASKALAAAEIAVWDGHNYAVEVVDQLGLSDSGGVIRAGVSRYVEPPDVDRLLAAVSALAR